MPDIRAYDRWEGVSRSADLSECGRYRWWLRRSWQRVEGHRVVCFVMLNPSTADALQDDPTIRRCMGFALSWGYSVMTVRNLFPVRATDPKELLTVENPTGGSEGDSAIGVGFTCDLLVAAWGAWVPFGRVAKFKEYADYFHGKTIHCLGLTKGGHPRHPLYVRGDAQPVEFPRANLEIVTR